MRVPTLAWILSNGFQGIRLKSSPSRRMESKVEILKNEPSRRESPRTAIYVFLPVPTGTTHLRTLQKFTFAVEPALYTFSNVPRLTGSTCLEEG